MRKAARKQKKLAKLESKEKESLLVKTSIELPELKELSIYSARSRSVFNPSGGILAAPHDYPGIAYAISRSNILHKLNCQSDIKLLECINEALKINTSIKFLTFTHHFVTTEDLNPYMQAFFPIIRDILQYNNLTTCNVLFDATFPAPPNIDSELIIGLKNNTSLTSLTMPSYRYTPESMHALADVISNHPNLVDLTFFSGHQASKDGWKYMASIVLSNRLRKLSFGTRYNVWKDTFGPVFDALQHNTSLTFLSFEQQGAGLRDECSISEAECDVLSNSLRANQTLTKLNINGMKLGSNKMSKIFDALQHHTALTDLNFWEKNKLDADIAPSLGAFLQVNESLTELDLSYSNITAEACQHFGPALKNNRSITSLNLFMNPICSEGCKYLAEGLKFNKALIRVNLKDCKIQDGGCVYLGEAIKTNQCLLHLDISGHEIKTEGYKALIEGMKENDSLTDLTLSKDRSVPSELHDEIVTIQNRNRQYQRELKVTTITMLIQIARSDAFDMFPLEIWLRIFKHFVCGGVPGFNHIAESILMHSDVVDLTSLCKMRIVRINGKSHLVQKNTDE